MKIVLKTLFAVIIWIFSIYKAACQDDVSYNITHGISTPVFTNDSHTCHLRALHEDYVNEYIVRLMNGGIKLIEYHLTFPNYAHNPLTTDIENYYKPDIWQRISSKHGQTLLSLPYDYNILSLSLLSFGVERLEVNLTDVPEFCLTHLNEEQKISAVRVLLTHDFRPHSSEATWLEDSDKICHEKIHKVSNMARFRYECCIHDRDKVTTKCSPLESNRWISYLYNIINFMDVMFFLFGPLIAQKLFARKSFRVTQYIVKLVDPQLCKLCKHVVGKSNYAETSFGGTPSVPETNIEILQPASKAVKTKRLASKYSNGLAKLPNETPADVTMSTLYIQVDHKRLMSEKDVSVGLFKFLWDQIVLCHIKRHHPFLNCCKQSLFGSWSGKFFCAVIPTANALSKFFTTRNSATSCSWKNIFQVLGLLLALLIVPIPFFIRGVLYFSFEKDEYDSLDKITKTLGLSVESRTVFHFSQDKLVYLYVTSFTAYFLSMLLLIIIYKADKVRFTEHVTNILQDLKHINRLECFRLYALHIIMPFEKFGILGLLVAIPYWIFIFPVITCVVLFYCIPTVYLIGRFIFHRQPDWLDKILCCVSLNGQHYDTIGKMFMFSYISPQPEHVLPVKPLDQNGKWSGRERSEYGPKTRFILGVLLSICMLSILALYAEIFRYLVEVATLTLMGAMANAGSAGQYFMLAFFLVTYTVQVFNNLADKYQTLASRIFTYIKGKLDDSAVKIIRLRGAEQKNVAFKFFSKSEIQELLDERHLSTVSEYDKRLSFTDDCQTDRFCICDGTLHWKLRSLVFFIDRDDHPRIPKKLFDKICDLRINGVPGPVYMNILIAFRQLSYMIVFLLFVVLVVLAFGDAYNISTTNQLLLTLVGGFLPFVFIRILKPKGASLDLNTYSFQGKVHEIIHKFTQTWPIYDLDFDVCPSDDAPSTADDEPVASPEAAELLSFREVPTYGSSASAEEISILRHPAVHRRAERVSRVQVDSEGVDLTLDVEYTQGHVDDTQDECVIQ